MAQLHHDLYTDLVKLSFRWDIGIFYSTTNQMVDIQGRQCFLAGKMEPSSYMWILEIAENRQTCFPLLEFVSLMEITAQRGHRVFLSEKWAPPLAIDQVFDQAGVDLEVSVRAPRR